MQSASYVVGWIMKHEIKDRSNVKRSIGGKVWRLLSKLPLFLRAPVIRNMFSVSTDVQSEFIFKQAETLDEVQQAMQLVFESYYQRGLVPDIQSKMRATKFHMLPTTSILICKKGSKVVATVSLIVDSGLGFPIDELWNISQLRRKSARIAEVSSLAIQKEYRAQRGVLLLSLCSFMLRHAYNCGVDRLVACYHPEVQDFYRCVILFSDIEGGNIRSSASVQGAAAIGGTRDLKTMEADYRRVYSGKKASKDIHHLFFGPVPNNFHFSKGRESICSNFVFTPENMNIVFKDKTDVALKLTQKESTIIAQALHHPEFAEVLNSDFSEAQRCKPRFAVNFQAVTSGYLNHATKKLKILDISRKGLRLNVQNAAQMSKIGEIVILEVTLPNGQKIPLSGQVIWVQDSQLLMGVKLNIFSPLAWQEFIDLLETELKFMATSMAGEQTAS